MTLGRPSASYKICSHRQSLNQLSRRGPSSGAALNLYTAVAKLRSTKQLARFWSKVVKLNGHDACWVWTSARNKQGYGLFWVAPIKRAVPAHRISFALAGGEVPDGFWAEVARPRGSRGDLTMLSAKANALDEAIRTQDQMIGLAIVLGVDPRFLRRMATVRIQLMDDLTRETRGAL